MAAAGHPWRPIHVPVALGHMAARAEGIRETEVRSSGCIGLRPAGAVWRRRPRTRRPDAAMPAVGQTLGFLLAYGGRPQNPSPRLPKRRRARIGDGTAARRLGTPAGRKLPLARTLGTRRASRRAITGAMRPPGSPYGPHSLVSNTAARPLRTMARAAEAGCDRNVGLRSCTNQVHKPIVL